MTYNKINQTLSYRTTLLIIFLALYHGVSFASFSLSGTTITQAGTDTNLSGLAGIPGVTTYTIGTGSTQRTIYDIGSLYLRYDNLTINPEFEELHLGSSSPHHAFMPSSSSSILTIGNENIKNGERIISENIAIVNHRQPVDVGDVYHPNRGQITINQGALYWWQGTIKTNLVMHLGGLHANLGNTDLTAGSFVKEGAVIECFGNPTYTSEAMQLTTRTAVLEIDGLKLRGVSNNTNPVFAPRILLNTPPKIILEGAYGVSSHVTVGNWLEMRDYKSRGNAKDLNLFFGSKIKAINTNKGSATIVRQHNNRPGDAHGVVEIRKEWEATINNLSGQPVKDVRYYIKDTNNGDRRNGHSETYTNDFIYSNLTDANGKTGIVDVLTAVVVRSTHGVEGDDIGANKKDRRSKNNNTDDEFDIYFYDYTHIPTKVTKKLKGIGTHEFELLVIEDKNISEANVATVAGYTTIENLDQLYDYAKYWKGLNSNNMEKPTVGDLLLTANGKNLELPSDWNLTLDATIGTPISVDNPNKTITVKATFLKVGKKFKGIVTPTGQVSVTGGSKLEVGYIDNTGINKFVHLDWGVQSTTEVKIKNIVSNTNIKSTTSTEEYKEHFLAPSTGTNPPVPTDDVEVNVETINGYLLYSELIPKNDLTFIRLNLDFMASEVHQKEIIYLTRKLLQKTEAVNSALGGATPNITDNSTITNNSQAATKQNQIAILGFLKQIIKKASATREMFNED